jgi:hypothetical protein
MIGHGHVLNTCPLSPQLLQNIVISTLPSSKLLFRFKQMSSQSSTTVSTDYQTVTRDASDVTRQRKEFLIYNEKKSGTRIVPGGASLVSGRPGVTPAGVNHLPAGNAELLWIPQGNQYRLSYLFGKMETLSVAGTPAGGAFNLDGPIKHS